MLEYLAVLLAISLIVAAFLSLIRKHIPLSPRIIYGTVGISFVLGAFFPAAITALNPAGATAVYFGLIVIIAVALGYIESRAYLHTSEPALEADSLASENPAPEYPEYEEEPYDGLPVEETAALEACATQEQTFGEELEPEETAPEFGEGSFADILLAETAALEAGAAQEQTFAEELKHEDMAPEFDAPVETEAVPPEGENQIIYLYGETETTPSIQAAENELYEDKPAADTCEYESAAEVYKPATDINEPDAEISEPTPDSSEPDVDLYDSAEDMSSSATDAGEPAADIFEPDADLPEPASDILEPGEDLDKPAADTLEPDVDLSGPAADTFEPGADLSGPAAYPEQVAPTSLSEPDADISGDSGLMENLDADIASDSEPAEVTDTAEEYLPPPEEGPLTALDLSMDEAPPAGEETEYYTETVDDEVVIDTYRDESPPDPEQENDMSGEGAPDIIPAPVTMNDYISAGFKARNAGNLVEAVKYFITAFQMNREQHITATLAFEISAVYQELGQYSQAGMIVKSILEQENFISEPQLRQKLAGHLLFLETLDELLLITKMPNAPYSKIPGIIKVKAILETEKKQKEFNQGGGTI